MQNLQHDINDPNDCSEGDDHDADKVRYICMDRPWAKDAPPKEIPLASKFKPPSIDDLWAMREELLNTGRR